MKAPDLIVTRAPGTSTSEGILRFGRQTWPCVIGKNGITTRKQEGDMKTPAGAFAVLYAMHRKTRIPFIQSQLPIRQINQDDGWCDEPNNSNYNRPVKLPFSSSHETLHREDGLYDLIIVIDHNYKSRIKNRGSAVFFHLTDKKPYTAGCVAIPEKVMRYLLPKLTPGTRMIIKA